MDGEKKSARKRKRKEERRVNEANGKWDIYWNKKKKEIVFMIALVYFNML